MPRAASALRLLGHHLAQMCEGLEHARVRESLVVGLTAVDDGID
jgi:hypothetical protein